MSVIALLFLSIAGIAVRAEAVELHEAAIVSAGHRSLENSPGDKILGDARLGHIALHPNVPVPEPGPLALLIAGSAGLLAAHRHRSRSLS